MMMSIGLLGLMQLVTRSNALLVAMLLKVDCLENTQVAL